MDVGEELGRHGMEEGSPQRRGEGGRGGLTLLSLQVAPLAENGLGDLASKSLSHGRTDAGQRRGRSGTRELGRPW